MPDDLDLGGVDPSFLEDGLGISGQQADFTDEDVQDWDLNAWSDDRQSTEDFSAAGSDDNDCVPSDPPEEGTHVWGSIDGECQWIDTTDCSA